MFPRSETDFGIAPWLLSYIKELENLGLGNIVLAPSYKGLGAHRVFDVDVRRFRYFIKRFERLTHEENAPARIRRKPVYSFELPFFLLCGYNGVKKIIEKDKPDLVHIHWPFPMVFVGASAFGKLPVVLKFYSAELALLRKFRIFKPAFSYYVKKSSLLLANSSFTQKLIIDEFGCPSEILYDGYFFPENPPEVVFPEPSKRKEILFVGRLVERKGIEYLIKAVAMIGDKLDIQLKIIGDGPELSDLQILTKDLSVESRVVFCGRIPDDERNRAYKECDLFVLPACYDRHGDTEGLGTVLLEALSAGKPVIGTNVGGIPDIIKDNQTGLLVPEKNPEALANAIEKILSNRELYIKLARTGFEYT
ncbi:MAG: glycosyltransferase family 4 protein, partial [bacterium]